MEIKKEDTEKPILEKDKKRKAVGYRFKRNAEKENFYDTTPEAGQWITNQDGVKEFVRTISDQEAKDPQRVRDLKKEILKLYEEQKEEIPVAKAVEEKRAPAPSKKSKGSWWANATQNATQALTALTLSVSALWMTSEIRKDSEKSNDNRVVIKKNEAALHPPIMEEGENELTIPKIKKPDRESDDEELMLSPEDQKLLDEFVKEGLDNPLKLEENRILFDALLSVISEEGGVWKEQGKTIVHVGEGTYFEFTQKAINQVLASDDFTKLRIHFNLPEDVSKRFNINRNKIAHQLVDRVYQEADPIFDHNELPAKVLEFENKRQRQVWV